MKNSRRPRPTLRQHRPRRPPPTHQQQILPRRPIHARSTNRLHQNHHIHRRRTRRHIPTTSRRRTPHPPQAQQRSRHKPLRRHHTNQPPLIPPRAELKIHLPRRQADTRGAQQIKHFGLLLGELLDDQHRRIKGIRISAWRGVFHASHSTLEIKVLNILCTESGLPIVAPPEVVPRLGKPITPPKCNDEVTTKWENPKRHHRPIWCHNVPPRTAPRPAPPKTPTLRGKPGDRSAPQKPLNIQPVAQRPNFPKTCLTHHPGHN